MIQSPTHPRKSSSAGVPSTTARKAGSPIESPQGQSGNFSTARRNVASAIVKVFVEQTALAEKQGTFKVPAEKTNEGVAEELGLAIENAMYHNLCDGAGEPNEAYKQQFRTISFNVKKNPSLRDRLLVGTLSPEAISRMSTQDMASEELRQKDDEIKREAEKQHIIIQEQGPRIRRTHKGEELVEDDTQAIGTESVFSAAPARRDTAHETDGSKAMSPEARAVSPPVSQQPEFQEYNGPAEGSQQQSQHAPTDSHGRSGNRRSSSTFNIQNVWSNVQSPESAPTHKPPPTSSYEEASADKVQADAEIDQLLKDEEVDSPPYSPKDFHSDEMVWRGRIIMAPIADFPAQAKYVGGADLSDKISWEQLMPYTLAIDGRIDIRNASNYLCGLRFSHTTNVSVTSISPPESESARAQFDKLFQYFADRKRYGVIGKHPLSAVKDAYVIPVETGLGNRPEFIDLLDNYKVEDPVPERLLLVVLVVKISNNNNNHSSPQSGQPTPRDPAYAPSPLTATPSTTIQQPQFTAFAGLAPSNSISSGSTAPGVLAPGNSASNPQLALPQHFSRPYQPAQSAPQNLTGAAAASQVLGPLASCTAVEQLLRQAPNADVEQFKVVAGILAQIPNAANDYDALTGALVRTTNGQ